MKPLAPVHTSALFGELHQELMSLLGGLTPDQWEAPTVAGKWEVRDVAAHILDGQVRRLSFQRDGHPMPDPSGPIDGYHGLVRFLNTLNAEWVTAYERVSPSLLMEMLDLVGPQLSEFAESLDPDAPAFFPVAWAGEVESKSWMDIGRDYTELWHHQAQIRDAVQAPLLSEAKWMAPLLQLGVRALSRSLASLVRPEGTTIALTVHGEGGGSWAARVEKGAWGVMEGRPEAPGAEVELEADMAWRLLFNAVSGREARREARASGDEELLEAVFDTRSVMV